MKNLWIQHLEKAIPEDRERGASFVKMLHSLAREGWKEKGHLRKNSSSQYSDSNVSGREERCNPACNEKSPDDAIGMTSASAGSQLPADQDVNGQKTWKELCRWTAKSQRGCEAGTDVRAEDSVQLLLIENGELTLRYKVTGEDIFETGVDSAEEAESMILEDNMTTASLYPGNPEFQWIKNNSILI